MNKKNIIKTTILLIILFSTVYACGVVRLSQNGSVFIGNNEDSNDNRTLIWFMPTTNSEYGRICFGYKNPYDFVEGGMNEFGLTLDALATSPTGWKKDPNKPDFKGHINDYILANFATVDEVKEWFNNYNVIISNGEFMIADSTGKSMIVEYVKGEYRFIESDKHYQIATNFVQYGKKEEEFSDRRYNIAKSIALKENIASVANMKKILSAIHQEWFSPTVYSYICDLKSKTIYVYNFHNFEDVYKINLLKELKLGKHYYDLPSLFSIKIEAAYSFEEIAPKRGEDELKTIIEQEGYEFALNWFNTIKDKEITAPVYKFNETDLNLLGYEYLWKKDYKTAITIFEINTSAHPNSWNVWDSLAEGHMMNGDKNKAIEFYKKSLKINPNNQNAKKQLNILKKK